jgi:hypothetical protein
MRTLGGIYCINAISFLSNLAAVFVFINFSGANGYGTYGIYLVFLSAYYLWEICIVKSALIIQQEKETDSIYDSDFRAVAFLRGSFIPFVIGSLVLVALGNTIYPVDAQTWVGGSAVAFIVACEHFFGYPANRLVYHLTIQNRFQAIYILRLGSTFLRHACAWGVLILTGSVQWAMAAILIKGIALGAFSLWWIKRKISRIQSTGICISKSQLVMLGGFFGAAIALLALQEIPSFYINRFYGRVNLGIYRSFYDIVNAVWFLATIYPTILFAHLLKNNASPQIATRNLFFSVWSKRISLFHLVFFFIVCFCISFDRLLSINFIPKMPYLIGLTGGVAILGYSRFLIEVAQSHKLSSQVLVSTLVAFSVVIIVFYFSAVDFGINAVAWAWLIGQTVFFILLKVALHFSRVQSAKDQWDVVILVLPILTLTIFYSFLSQELILGISALGALSGIVVLIMLLLRPFNVRQCAVS